MFKMLNPNKKGENVLCYYPHESKCQNFFRLTEAYFTMLFGNHNKLFWFCKIINSNNNGKTGQETVQ